VLRRPVERGQYVSIRYTERLAEAGIEPSVGSVGDAYDNALAETVNGLYKAEVIHRRSPWKTLKRSSWPRSNGSPGSTTIGCWSPSATCHPPKLKPPTTASSPSQP
jgi:transposase InsO family protein